MEKKTTTKRGFDNIVNHKLPAFDIEAEQAVLGAILLNNEAIWEALEHMVSEDFYKRSNREIFDAMITLIEVKEKVDLLTLRDELSKRGELEKVGDAPYIAALMDVVPTASNISSHAKIVHEKALVRQLGFTAIQLTARCYDCNETAGELIADAEKKVFEIADGGIKRPLTPPLEYTKKAFEKIEQLAQCKFDGLRTEYKDLDDYLRGLKPGIQYIIGARPSMGKTAKACCIAKNLSINQNKTGVFFSLEMTEVELAQRLILSAAKLNAFRSSLWNDEEWTRLTYFADLFSQSHLYIDDTSHITVLDMHAKLRRLKREKGLDYAVIDHLTLIKPSRRTNRSRNDEVGEISWEIKKMAKDLEIPIITLCQLSRKVEDTKDKRPILSHLRDSGEIEQNADVVIFLYRPEYYFKDSEEYKGLCEVIIAKHRGGPVGTVNEVFLKEYTLFQDLSNIEGKRHSKENPF